MNTVNPFSVRPAAGSTEPQFTFYSERCGSNTLEQYEEELGCDRWMTTGIYCHGKLQEWIGYDIAYIPRTQEEWEDNIVDIPEGKYVCNVKANGITYKAIAYIWPATNSDVRPWQKRGLIILPGDEDTDYVEKKFAEKSQYL